MSPADISVPILRCDICSLSAVRRVAAMLDFDPNAFVVGGKLPVSWHFFLLGGQTMRADLREDGFPGFGVPIPDLGLPRLFLGGRKVSYENDISIGDELDFTSVVSGLTEKQTEAGPIAIVKISHELTLVGSSQTAIREEQTYFLLKEAGKSKKSAPVRTAINAEYSRAFIPDDTLLFQYSALGFNSHKIHLDREYAQKVEGLPDLIVNGGLVTLLASEFLRNGVGAEVRSMTTRHVAPLYVNREMTIAVDRTETGWSVAIFDDAHTIAVEMNVVSQ